MPVDPRPRSERGMLRRAPEPYGRSVLGAPLHVWSPERESHPLLVVAGVHGEEGESVSILSAALRTLPEGTLGCWVVLAHNPDGLARGTRANARGVDLNRNFPASTWSPERVRYRWTLEDPRDVELSPGDAPASEPETSALVDLVHRVDPRLILAIHAPLACIDDPSDTALGAWLADRTGLPHVRDVGYPTPGSLGTWGAEQGIGVVTFELEREAPERLLRRHLPLLVDLLSGDALER